MNQNPFLDAALAAANRGWKVFPVIADGKRPAISEWERRATSNKRQIYAWWSGKSRKNIGVACGPSNLVVVDLDGPHEQERANQLRHGRQELVILAAGAGQMVPADTFSVLTPKGQHIYFEAPPGVELRNTAGRLANKIDTRARGGYVVGAGSIVDGQLYRLVCDLPPQPLPPWLLQRLARRSREPGQIHDAPHGGSYVVAAVRNEVGNVAEAAVGRRNHTLFVAAARLARFVTSGVLTEADVRRALRDASARHLGVQSSDDAEVMRTIDSGLRRGQTAKEPTGYRPTVARLSPERPTAPRCPQIP